MGYPMLVDQVPGSLIRLQKRYTSSGDTNWQRKCQNDTNQVNKSCSYRTYADLYSKEMTNRVQKWIYHALN